MATRLSDKLAQHINRVEILAAAGITPPKDWIALRDRFDTYRQQPKPALDRLVAAIVTGAKDEDTVALKAHALAESCAPQQEATVDNRVGAAVEFRLIETYAAAAAGNYAKAANQFDALAKQFTDAAAVVDPETDAAVMARVDVPDAQRRAWGDAERFSYELDVALTTLVCAAELAGLRVGRERDEHLLALAVDAGSLHRRKVWAGWETTTGRTRRWGALVKLGATIRAYRPLENLEKYRRPRPLEHRQEQQPGAPRGYVVNVTVDPEDADYKPNPQQRAGRMVAT